MAEAAMSHREVYPPRVAATRACSAHADRFLAAAEAEVPDGYKAAIVAAASQDAGARRVRRRRVPARIRLGPVQHAPARACRTEFVDRYNAEPPADGRAVSRELLDAMRAGRGHELVPFGGQTAGLIDRVVPARAIVEDDGPTRRRDRLAAVSRATARVRSAREAPGPRHRARRRRPRRGALPDDDLEGSEVLVVSPAVNESAVAFWMSDSDEAIAEAESTAESTAAQLRERGANARSTTGRASRCSRCRTPSRRSTADRVVVFVRDEDAARYREDDVVGEAERRFGVPVTEVTI
jgi:hypothetical protein